MRVFRACTDGAAVDLQALGEQGRVADPGQAVAIDRVHRLPPMKRRFDFCWSDSGCSKTSEASSPRARENLLFSSARTIGTARFTAAGTAGSSGSSNAIGASSAARSPSARERPERPCGWRRGDAIAVEAEPVDRLQPDANVLQRRDLGVADEQQLVGVVERSEHRRRRRAARCRRRSPRTRCGRRRAPPRAPPGRPRRPLRAASAPAGQRARCAGQCSTKAASFRVDVSRRGGEVGDRRARGHASVSAESPNCRSRSTRSVRMPSAPSRPRGSSRGRSCRSRPWARRRSRPCRARCGAALAALRIANSSVSAGCGRTSTSTAPTARPVSTIPFGSP